MMTTRDWIDAKQNPDQWAAEHGCYKKGSQLECRLEVRLLDGRQIFTWWKDGQWSVERLKPHLKVAYWKRMVIIG